MAVFTEVPFTVAAALFECLGAGRLSALEGVASGIENTNYFATTAAGQYVLTLFERMSRAELPYYLELLRHLALRQLPVAEPQADAHGQFLYEVCGKPAAVMRRLRGSPELAPDDAHCAALGDVLARLHLAGAEYPHQQLNPRGLSWCSSAVAALARHVDAAQHALMTDELSFQHDLAASLQYRALPRGAIHADLFRDNVLFEGHQLTGLLDFYFAGFDTFLFDLAVCLNDWCSDTRTGALSTGRAAIFLHAYSNVRALSADERVLLAPLLRAAALRFWLSRLCDLHMPRHAALLQPHDPAPFERMLRLRRAAG